MDESHPLGARTMYGASKIAGEYFLRSFNDQYGLPYVTLRYMNVYGPRQEGGLVMAVARRVLAGEAPTITGDGSQSFDFVHVADVAGANVAAMASDVSAEEFNVGSGTEASAREIAEKLIEIVGADVEVRYRPDVRVLMRRRVGSNEKAKRLLGWEAEIPLDDGLRDTVDWIRAALVKSPRHRGDRLRRVASRPGARRRRPRGLRRSGMTRAHRVGERRRAARRRPARARDGDALPAGRRDRSSRTGERPVPGRRAALYAVNTAATAALLEHAHAGAARRTSSTRRRRRSTAPATAPGPRTTIRSPRRTSTLRRSSPAERFVRRVRRALFDDLDPAPRRAVRPGAAEPA